MEIFEFVELAALIAVLALLWDTHGCMRELSSSLESLANKVNRLEQKE